MSAGLRQLAVEGGAPLFAEPVRVGAPNRVDGERLATAIRQVIDRRRLTNDGPLAREYEERLGELCGAHAVLVVNGTAALLVAGRALGLSGRIAVPSWTFVASVHAVSLLGAEPVFVDVDESHTMDPLALERIAAAGAIDGVMPVHLFGGACDIEAIGLQAAGMDVPVLYDGAQALGTTIRDHPIGRFGTASAFSLHATKWMSAIEGGFITTEDAALAEECRRRRNFGIVGPDAVAMVGTNAKMSELHAAAGLVQLDRFDELAAHNEACFAAYRAVLDPCPDVSLLDVGPTGTSARPYVAIELAADRDVILAALAAEGVDCRRYFFPGVHRFPPYADLPLVEPLPVTERLAAGCLALPTGDQLTPSDARRIGELVVELATASPERRRSWDVVRSHRDEVVLP
ncbi:MAG: DegT/DnrJ/EryC1/StrS family aminotransferase [Actinomycetota bacterium]